MMQKITAILMKPLTIVIALVLSLGLAGASYYMYQNSQQELAKIKSDPRSVAQEEAKALIAKIGGLIALPAGEDPTVATITDKEKLKDQPFFVKAENGDKVLIYTSAKKAYLYRESINKVIDVAPINIGTNSNQVAGEPTSQTPTKTP